MGEDGHGLKKQLRERRKNIMRMIQNNLGPTIYLFIYLRVLGGNPVHLY